MYKLIFSIIIFAVGFSNLTKAQNLNNSATAKVFVNENSQHFKNTSPKDSLVVYKYKSQNKVGHKKNNAHIATLQCHKILEKTKGNDTTSSSRPAHKKVTLHSKTTNLQYVRVDKNQDSLKAKKLHKTKDN